MAWPILRLRGLGHGRWAARSGAVVRFLQRAVLLEVGEDGADGDGFFDAGHDPYRTAAVDAGAHVDAHQIAGSDLEQPKAGPKGGGQDARSKHALEALRPGHPAALLLGAARLVGDAGLNRRGIGRRPLPTSGRRQLRAQVCVGGEYAVEPGQMRAWRRHQRRQLGDEVHRIPFDMRGAVAPRGLELVAHSSLRRDRQPLFADRRARDVPAQLFQRLAFMRLGGNAGMQRESADLAGIAFQQTGVAGQRLQACPNDAIAMLDHEATCIGTEESRQRTDGLF